jgi:site-specific DNA-methyltransferase (adenine-specific)
MGTARAGAAVVCGDAAALLPAMPDGCIDAVVTDPPWNLGRPYGRHDDALPAPVYSRWLAGVVAESTRVSRGPVVFFLGGHNDGLLRGLLAAGGLREAARVHWRRMPGARETVMVAARGPLALPAGELRAARRTLESCGEEPERFGHPCPKPVAAMGALIRLVTVPGALVLDPFAGTGTTLVAAVRCGRRGIGAELEPRFCRVAAERLAVEAAGGVTECCGAPGEDGLACTSSSGRTPTT